MHGDFSRETFDPARNFTRVLQQQGRLVLDADANEQSAIMLDYLRRLGADLIGWHGGVGVAKDGTGAPQAPGPFVVTVAADKVTVSVSAGKYYVDGLYINSPATADGEIRVLNNKQGGADRLVFLDMWERHVPSAADSDLYDPALGGLDTVTRVKLEATVCTVFKDKANIPDFTPGQKKTQADLRNLVYTVSDGTNSTTVAINTRPLGGDDFLPKLAAWTIADRDPAAKAAATPVPPAPDCDGVTRGGFTGLENQLYRVEVQFGGAVVVKKEDGGNPNKVTTVIPPAGVTIKWSRDNGSVVYPYADLKRSADKCQLTLTATWRDAGRAIAKDNWVELFSPAVPTGVLLRVDAPPIREASRTELSLSAAGLSDAGKKLLDQLVTAENGLLRRWDHLAGRLADGSEKVLDGAVQLLPDPDFGKDTDDFFSFKPVNLEDGLTVRLVVPHPKKGDDFSGPIPELRAGDYWLIPARYLTGDVLWRLDQQKKAVWQPARYAEHHYAPLAIITGADGTVADLRRAIAPAAGS